MVNSLQQAKVACSIFFGDRQEVSIALLQKWGLLMDVA